MFPVHDSTVGGDHDTDGAGTCRIVVRRFEVYRREGAHQRLAFESVDLGFRGQFSPCNIPARTIRPNATRRERTPFFKAQFAPISINHGAFGVTGFASLCYNLSMEQKPLIETNPYLRDPEKFRKALITSVASSTAIETGALVASIARMLEESDKTEPLTTTQGSAR